ncbi:hypothetical protein GGR01_000829 [Acetobacter oeni]|nr:hypothetical protein [Acetobacter oeni]
MILPILLPIFSRAWHVSETRLFGKYDPASPVHRMRQLFLDRPAPGYFIVQEISIHASYRRLRVS